MQTSKTAHGFTLIEILVIAPIVILFIGAFISLIVSLTGDSLKLQESNTAAYSVQDALDDIEANATQSMGFLTTTGTLQSPQGKNNGTAAFLSTDANTLVTNSAATTSSPYNTTRSIIYTGSGACDSSNPVYTYRTVYFISNNSLYKRTILPLTPACAIPWQRGSCTQTYMSGAPSFCSKEDEKLLDNVSAMQVKYYADGSSTSEIAASSANTATSISIDITYTKQVGGEPVTYTGSARINSISPQDTSSQAIPPLADITFSQNSNTPYTTTFSWDSIGSASGYNIRYRVGTATWINGPQNTSQTSYDVPATGRNQNVDIEVTVVSTGGSYLYGTKSTTVPNWNDCPYSNNWVDYTNGWPGAGFTRTTSNVVMLRGLVKGGTTTAGTVICTLPPGFRPDSVLMFQAWTSGTTAGRLDVDTSGRVIFYSGTNTFFNLSTVSFVAGGNGTSTKTLSGFNSWVNYGGSFSPVKIIKDSTGRGHLQGLGKSGSTAAGNAFGDFSGGYAYNDDNIYPAMNTGYAPESMQLTGSYVNTRAGLASNGYWSLQAMIYPTGSASWQNASLVNGWVNYNTTPGYALASYTKGSDDIVSLQGLIKSGTVTTGTTIFTLPAGYRPTDVTMCGVITNPDVPARIDVLADGRVITREGDTAGWLSLAGCDFLAS